MYERVRVAGRCEFPSTKRRCRRNRDTRSACCRRIACGAGPRSKPGGRGRRTVPRRRRGRRGRRRLRSMREARCGSARRTAWGAGISWGRTSTYAVHGLAVLLAFLTHKLDAPCREEGAAGGRVAHLDEAGVEVDLGGEGADRDEGGGADAEDGRDGLVEEALVAVGGLLEDQDVAAGALGGADLRKNIWRLSICGEIHRRALYVSCGNNKSHQVASSRSRSIAMFGVDTHLLYSLPTETAIFVSAGMSVFARKIMGLWILQRVFFRGRR